MGAWSAYYKKGNIETANTPRGYGLLALKKELVYQGFGTNLVLNYQFGETMRKRTVEFQKSQGLEADGIIGPKTAKELFRERIYAAETEAGISDHLTFKQISLESNFDPSAFVDHGTSGVDRSLCQINSKAHPEVTDAQAYSPEFAIPWAAQYLKDHIDALGDVDAGLAAYNVGRFYARKWLEAGKPSSGLFTSTGKDYAEICTKYTKLIRAQQVS